MFIDEFSVAIVNNQQVVGDALDSRRRSLKGLTERSPRSFFRTRKSFTTALFEETDDGDISFELPALVFLSLFHLIGELDRPVDRNEAMTSCFAICSFGVHHPANLSSYFPSCHT